MPTRSPWRLVAAWRNVHRPAAAAVAAAVLGVGGCSALQTPSMSGGKNAAARTLSPEQLRQVAATFESQGREERADRLFAVADRRAGVRPAPPGAPRPMEPPAEPPSPVPPAATQLAQAPPAAPAPTGPAARPAPGRVQQVSADVEAAAPVTRAGVVTAAGFEDAAQDGPQWGPTSSGAAWRPIARPEPEAFAVRRVPLAGAAAPPEAGMRPIPRLDATAPAP
ncbi:hypothetical protein [Alienimonas californiensis]|uniref:Uncharacterized protein n=1 Tax=Alienimonas californiensis TaxID=2527989 RepID=A0A517PCJ5_9PLAN|nr:hypothetical protein [Alienimonas californiensis]QDT17076.1 hypothetical protein CA12_31880 [Alienimonas californiensis]